MDIRIEEARPIQIPVIQNLARFYVYDMAEYMGWACPENGLYGCRDDKFWSDERSHFFIVRVDGELAGFAVIEELEADEDEDYDVAEFFVMRKFRHRGVGKYVAHKLFDKFRGRWVIKQLVGNLPAPKFWRAAISDYTSGEYEEMPEFTDESGWRMIGQRFYNGI